MEAVSPEDWAQVAENVLNLIKELVRRVELLEEETKALRAENELLKEQVARTSGNLSQPPSKNPQGFKLIKYWVFNDSFYCIFQNCSAIPRSICCS
jgi:SMC interacting uncharacterized protein involved in chromosome segregation